MSVSRSTDPRPERGVAASDSTNLSGPNEAVLRHKNTSHSLSPLSMGIKVRVRF